MAKDDELAVGTVLAGKYRVERVLGRGGMGVVVAARHLQLGELVALKFLLPDMLEKPEVVERFQREARAAVRIKSEHVARVTDVGALESGAPYMVMEYIDGKDLGDVLTAGGALSVATAIEYVAQACEAIAQAHALGIVHRDLKPSNLMLTTRSDGTPCVKVLDFGISKVLAGGQDFASMTQTAMALGSPRYMSPEQMASARDVDARTDIWALGIILYELVTGEAPFVAESYASLVLKVSGTEPTSLGNFLPNAPRALEAAVMRCLEKRRERRFSTVAEFLEALAPMASSSARQSIDRVSRILRGSDASRSSSTTGDDQRTIEAPRELSGSARSGARRAQAFPPDAPQHTGTEQNWTQTAGRGSRRKTAWFVLGGCAFLVVAGLVVVVGRKGDGPPPSAVAATSVATPSIAPPAATEPARAAQTPLAPAGATTESPAVPDVMPAAPATPLPQPSATTEPPRRAPRRNPTPGKPSKPTSAKPSPYDDM